jgi:hypothetical protein
MPSKSNSFSSEKEKNVTILKCLKIFFRVTLKKTEPIQDLQKPLNTEAIITLAPE